VTKAEATPRSRKDLACTAAALAYQKQFGLDLKRRVVEQAAPFVVAQADTPHEIFHTMDISLVTNQWWSAYISAKRLGGRYFQALTARGYPANGCRYCSLGLGCTLAKDPEAPWGGLPKPVALVARLTCDCIQHVFRDWARALDTEFFPMEAPAWTHKDPEWYLRSNDDWEEVFEPRRIGLLVAEMRELIRLLEHKTGRRFDEQRLMHLMERINEQEGYLAEAARALGAAASCPVSITDQMSNTMIPQWHRGSEWAVAHAKRFRDEVFERIAEAPGLARERVRLMWIGAGLWHDTGFYSALEEQLGAVFVWSMYMPFAGPQYIRKIKGTPMEALASRICSMNEVLHLPPWMNGWMVSEARRCSIDAAMMLVPPGNRLSQSGTHLTRKALERAGVPCLALDADMVDAKSWSQEQVLEHVGSFLRDAGLA
jgi:hypothetical protein